MKMTGSCCCGNIHFEVLEKPKYIGYCHCNICQKTHGSPFSAFAAFPIRSFNILKRSECFSYFLSSENVRRSFFSNCGSKIKFEHKSEKTIWISAGSLDFDPGLKAKSHMFTDSKAPWHEINDDLEKHERFPCYT